MIRAQQVPLLRFLDDSGQKLLGDLMADQALAVPREGARVERLLIEFEIQKPPIQKVVKANAKEWGFSAAC
jgi:hypothetical protein